MATVRCPKCGSFNPNGRRRLARCWRCREDLAGCQYCQFYDARMMDCTHPARPEELRIVDARESLNCPDFSTILPSSVVVARTTVPLLRTAVIAAAATLGLVFGGAWFHRAVIALPAEVSLRVSATAPSEASAEDGFDVRVLVRNEGDHAAEGVEVLISGKTMRKLICQFVEPPEAFVEAARRVARARIGRIEPGEIGSVRFHFSPKDPGEIRLTAQVIAANAAGPEKLPIEGEILP